MQGCLPFPHTTSSNSINSLHTPNSPTNLFEWCHLWYIHTNLCSLTFSHRPGEVASVWRLWNLVWYKLLYLLCFSMQELLKHDDWSSKHRLESASIRDKYFALIRDGNIPFRVGPLWTGNINTSFHLVGSRHNLTLLSGLATSIKLLDQSAVSSVPRV